MGNGTALEQRDLHACIDILLAGYGRYVADFKTITRNARVLFSQRNWKRLQSDTLKRLELYRKVVDDTESALRQYCGGGISTPAMWKNAKKNYIQHIAALSERELAETFFNSITRRIFKTVGVNAEIEFVNSEFGIDSDGGTDSICRRYRLNQDLQVIMTKIFDDFDLGGDFENKVRDINRASQKVEELIHTKGWGLNDDVYIEMVANPFYRDNGAYLVGRLIKDNQKYPLVFALHNDLKGIFLDAVLLHQDQLRILFSFSRSYFFVEVDYPYELVHFLKTLMPTKKRAEIYISLGFNKHGKTELYRDLLDYMTTCSEDRFRFADGKRGMVMIAFNMPNDDIIFKLIRDRFERPKKTSRKEVMQSYDYVFKHERAGRLLDVQTFEHLKIEDCCFEEDLLDELLNQATNSVHRENNHIVFEHVYVERRVTPLDVYLQRADWTAAKAAVLDFGQAIKDLAKVNIFPGDMLLKNFGVSRLGRVLFYDYDELCPLTLCNFRKIPPPRNEMDEMASEPWYFVDEHDVFPEEFRFFLGLPDDLRRVFISAHGDLFDIKFWRETQQRIRSGELIHITPYTPMNRVVSAR